MTHHWDHVAALRLLMPATTEPAGLTHRLDVSATVDAVAKPRSIEIEWGRACRERLVQRGTPALGCSGRLDVTAFDEARQNGRAKIRFELRHHRFNMCAFTTIPPPSLPPGILQLK